MRYSVLIVATAALSLAGAEAAAQFSSDLPGVPRASVPFRGGHQNRTTWNFNYFSVAGDSTSAAGDTLVAGARLSFGQSYRVGSRWEVGYDLALAEGLHVRPPVTEQGTGGSPIHSPAAGTYTRGAMLYALRMGVKFRPIHKLSPEGYGWEAAVGASFQPSLSPVFGVTVDGDSARTGGMVGSEGSRNLVGKLHQATQYVGMASYRTRRVQVDAALSYSEPVEPTDENGQPMESATRSYSGINPRIGGMFRVTPGIAAGVSWWGTGAPPWEDQINSRFTEGEKSSFVPFVSFGSKPESGVDLLVSSPTGSFTESVRLYIRARSTR